MRNGRKRATPEAVVEGTVADRVDTVDTNSKGNKGIQDNREGMLDTTG